MLCLGSIGMDYVIRESCYKGTILQRKIRKITVSAITTMVWLFSYNFFVKFPGEKFRSQLTVFNQNEVCYRGTAQATILL